MRRDATRVIGVGIVVILLTTCVPAAAAAQAPSTTPGPAEKRWSISGAFAGASRDHLRSFESAMRAAQFDDSSRSFFSGNPIEHPFSASETSVEAEVVFRLKRRLAIGLLRSPVMLGTTIGYQVPSRYLFVNQKVTVMAPIVYFRFGKHVRVGAGPLMAWTDVSDYEGLSQIETAYKSVTGGGIVAATVEGNPIWLLHLAVTASYRRIAPVTVGPFTATFPGTPSATLPAFTANLSHKSAGLSLGIRF